MASPRIAAQWPFLSVVDSILNLISSFVVMTTFTSGTGFPWPSVTVPWMRAFDAAKAAAVPRKRAAASAGPMSLVMRDFMSSSGGRTFQEAAPRPYFIPPAGGMRGPTAQLLLTSGRPRASFIAPVAIRITSTSHQIPQPPSVKSLKSPSPTWPR